MGDMVSIRFDTSGFDRLIRTGDEIYTKSLPAAMNKAMSKGKTYFIRRLSRRLNITPQALIGRRTKLLRASVGKLRAGIGILVRPIPTIRLTGTRQTETGVVSSGGRNWANAFINRGSGGHRMVFRRRDAARYPIFEAGVTNIEIRDDAQEDLDEGLAEAATNFERLLTHEIEWRMGGRPR
jgi:hypothetical protein